MRKSKAFFYFCLAFTGGIAIDSFFRSPQILILGLLIFGVFLSSVFWPKKKLVVIGFCFLFLVAGMWRHQQAWSEIVYPQDQQITFTGVVVAEPDIRKDNIKLTVEPEKEYSINGKVLVTADRYPEYQYGDRLKIKGNLQKAPEFEDFNYKEYLAKEGIYSVIFWSEIELLERGKHDSFFSAVYAKVLNFKDSLRESVYRNLSPPQSTILGAMILGDKRRLSDDLKEKLNVAGVRHITAVSGMHVAILTTILMSLLVGLGFWKKQAFYLTLAVILFFIIMTGLQPSAIRAGIMGSMFLLAQHLGRANLSSRTVVFAAVAMLAGNPLLLRLDVGFQLSFLAMMGIIYLMPFFQEKLKFIPKENLLNLRSVLALTLSAQVFTLPILIYNFGYMSLVAPLTNILIVPILPLLMGFGLFFGIFGMILHSLGWILSFPVWLLLTYIVKIIEWFSSLPLAYLTLENIHWTWLIAIYIILSCIAWRLQGVSKYRFGEYNNKRL